MQRLLVALLTTTLIGCQTQAYQQYADSMARIYEAQAQAEARRYDAIMELARTGGESTKLVAVALLATGTQNGKAAVQQQVAPPVNEALQWAQVILPSLTPIMLGLWNYKNTKQASKSASDTAQASYEAIFGVAKAGFDAAGSNVTTNVTETTTTNQTSYSVGGSGVIGSGSFVLNPTPVVPPVVNPP